MAVGATDDDLTAAEAALKVALPRDLREALLRQNGSESWYGDILLMLYGTEVLVSVNREVDRFAGFLAFGSDGSRDMTGYDLRMDPPPVVMLDITAGGRSDALFQADSLPAFLDRLERGDGLLWDRPYVTRKT